MNRRHFLNTVGVGTIGIIGVSQSGIAQSDNLSIQLNGPVIHQGSADFQPEGLITTRHSLEIGVNDQLSLGENHNKYIQVRNEDTGSETLIIPDEGYTGVEKISLQNVVGDDRQLKPEEDNLALTIDDDFKSNIPFSIEGDQDTYESGGIFSTFSVAIVEGKNNRTVLAETENTIRGVGWQRKPLTQEGTTGNVNVSFDIPEGNSIDESWYVEFIIRDDDFNVLVGPTELENNGNSIEGTIDISNLSPGEYERWGFDVYPSESQTNDSDAIISASGILSEKNIVVTESDNKEVWEYDAGDLVVSSPSVVEDTIYVGSNGSDIIAINKSTGDEEWIFEAGEFVNSSPAIVGDTLYIGSNDNKVYAIDRNTGEKEWEFDTGDNIRSSPTYANGTVFIGNGDFQDPVDTSVYAINADTGEQEWKYEVGDRISSAPIVDDGTVYVTSTDDNLYALNTDTGSLNWSKDVGAGGQSAPTIVNETVYVAGSGVTALDKTTGDEQWNYETDASFISTSPTVANGTLYIGISSKNKLSAINISSGTEEWSFQTGDRVYSSPTFVDGTVFVGSRDGNVYAIDANTGEKNWQFSAATEVGSSPIVADGILYVGTTQRDPYGGSVYAIDTGLDGSSEGSRSNFGTLGHNMKWYTQVTGDSAGSTNVNLRNVTITPDTVDGTTDTHTLRFEVVNLSPDDSQDEFSITLPDNININDASIVDAGDLTPKPEDPTPENPITFTVDPNETTEANMEVELSLSPSGD